MALGLVEVHDGDGVIAFGINREAVVTVASILIHGDFARACDCDLATGDNLAVGRAIEHARWIIALEEIDVGDGAARRMNGCAILGSTIGVIRGDAAWKETLDHEVVARRDGGEHVVARGVRIIALDRTGC